jgi:hypothetical protein
VTIRSGAAALARVGSRSDSRARGLGAGQGIGVKIQALGQIQSWELKPDSLATCSNGTSRDLSRESDVKHLPNQSVVAQSKSFFNTCGFRASFQMATLPFRST